MGKTHDMLMRAQAGVRHSQTGQVSTADFETKLIQLGLSNTMIRNKNISELRKCLIVLNDWIARLDNAFRSDTEQKLGFSSKDIDKNALSTLSDLRKSALQRYSTLINKQKIEFIKTQLNSISDKKLRHKIEANLLQIEIKDQLIQRECNKLDNILEKYRP